LKLTKDLEIDNLQGADSSKACDVNTRAEIDTAEKVVTNNLIHETKRPPPSSSSKSTEAASAYWSIGLETVFIHPKVMTASYICDSDDTTLKALCMDLL